MNPWVEAYLVGVFIVGVAGACGLLIALMHYGIEFDSGRSARRDAARIVLGTLFGTPVLALVWPVALVGSIVFGSYRVLSDALPESKSTPEVEPRGWY